MGSRKAHPPPIEPSTHHSKKTKPTPQLHLFDQDLFGASRVQQLQNDFLDGQPFPHVVLDKAFEEEALRKIREELIGGVKADFKETDIFKVFQSGDLANLQQGTDSESANISHLLELRDSLYSDEFRSFVEKITSSPPLSSKVDCSCNVYPKGGHLLCHDDVIGTRCVSYIMYLTDPDQEWSKHSGGALELYPVKHSSGTPSEPSSIPSTSLLPTWNRIVLFRVTPGVSFHAVQEVYSDSDHRLSISGWFHSSNEPEGIQNASLKQLKDVKGKDTLREFSSLPCNVSGDTLPTNCREYLREWVNPVYLTDESIQGVFTKFQADGSIQLQDFLVEDLSSRIRTSTVDADCRDFHREPPKGYQIGLGNGWGIIGPPHKQQYVAFTGTDNMDSCGSLLDKVRSDLFMSPEFASLLYQMTGAKPNGVFSEVRRFRPGLDYSVAHFGAIQTEACLDAVLCIVDEADAENEEAWAGGEVGGYESYLLADEDGDEKEAADVYKMDEDGGGLLSISPSFNTLNLVLRDEGLMRFIKYVSASAPGSRWDIAAEFSLSDDIQDKEN